MSDTATTPETPATPPRRRRRWLKIVLISVAVVVVGAVAASAAYLYSIDRSITQSIKRENVLPSEDPNAPRPERGPGGDRRPELRPAGLRLARSRRLRRRA